MALSLQLVVSSQNLNFGKITVGRQSLQTITVSLHGANSASAVTGALGTLPAGFSWVNMKDPVDFSVTVGSDAEFTIAFNPTSVASYGGTLNLTFNQPANGLVTPASPISITLSGAGISGAILNLNKTSLNYGAIGEDGNAVQSFDISNSPQAGVNLTATIPQPSDGAFSITQRAILITDSTTLDSSWVGATLPSGDTITAIGGPGIQINGTTWLQAADLSGQTITQAISGTLSLSLPPGEAQTIYVQFSPADVSVHKSLLSITHNDASKTNPYGIPIYGSGTNSFTFTSNNYELLDGSMVRLTLSLRHNGSITGYNSSLEALGISLGDVGENEPFRFDANQLTSFPGALKFTLLDDNNFFQNLIFNDTATDVTRIYCLYQRSTNGGSTWITEHEGCASIDAIQFNPSLSSHALEFTSTIFSDVLASYKIADIFEPPGSGRARTIGDMRYGTNTVAAGLMKNFELGMVILPAELGVVQFLEMIFGVVAQITSGNQGALFSFNVDYDYLFYDVDGNPYTFEQLAWYEAPGYGYHFWDDWMEGGTITLQEAVRRICQGFGISLRATSLHSGELWRFLLVPASLPDQSANLSDDDVQQFKNILVDWVVTWDNPSDGGGNNHICVNGAVVGGALGGVSDPNSNISKILQFNSNTLNQATGTLGIREPWCRQQNPNNTADWDAVQLFGGAGYVFKSTQTDLDYPTVGAVYECNGVNYTVSSVSPPFVTCTSDETANPPYVGTLTKISGGGHTSFDFSMWSYAIASKPIEKTNMPDGSTQVNLYQAPGLFWMGTRGKAQYCREDMPKLIGLDYVTDGLNLGGTIYFLMRMVKNYKECTTKFEAIPAGANNPIIVDWAPPIVNDPNVYSQPSKDTVDLASMAFSMDGNGNVVLAADRVVDRFSLFQQNAAVDGRLIVSNCGTVKVKSITEVP